MVTRPKLIAPFQSDRAIPHLLHPSHDACSATIQEDSQKTSGTARMPEVASTKVCRLLGAFLRTRRGSAAGGRRSAAGGCGRAGGPGGAAGGGRRAAPEHLLHHRADVDIAAQFTIGIRLGVDLSP